MEGGIPDLLAAAVRTASTQLTSENHPVDLERRTAPARVKPVRSRADRGSTGTRENETPDIKPETGHHQPRYPDPTDP